MGYTTDFNGELEIDPPLEPAQVEYLRAFNGTRRVKRDADKAARLPDYRRDTVGLPIGPQGAYYVGSADDGNFGQNDDGSIVDGNTPPGAVNASDFYPKAPGKYDPDWYEKYEKAQEMAVAEGAQPGLWCQWTVSEDGTLLMWDGGEKFYNYVEWLRYLVEHFFRPWGRKLDGEIYWQGEDPDDRGKIVVTANEIQTFVAKITYADALTD